MRVVIVMATRRERLFAPPRPQGGRGRWAFSEGGRDSDARHGRRATQALPLIGQGGTGDIVFETASGAALKSLKFEMTAAMLGLPDEQQERLERLKDEKGASSKSKKSKAKRKTPAHSKLEVSALTLHTPPLTLRRRIACIPARLSAVEAVVKVERLVIRSGSERRRVAPAGTPLRAGALRLGLSHVGGEVTDPLAEHVCAMRAGGVGQSVAAHGAADGEGGEPR
jgi:hypothetical protein